MAGLFDDINPLTSLSANAQTPTGNTITKGSLISFSYPRSLAASPNMIHDPRPMVIVTDIWPGHIRGVNLHYLTFPYIKRILQNFGGNTGFSYSHIKPDRFVANAFRMYNRAGVQQPKRLDTEWLLQVLASVRSFDPAEIEKIRATIEKQIQARLQAKAQELTEYDKWQKSFGRPQQQQLQDIGNQVLQTMKPPPGQIPQAPAPAVAPKQNNSFGQTNTKPKPEVPPPPTPGPGVA